MVRVMNGQNLQRIVQGIWLTFALVSVSLMLAGISQFTRLAYVACDAGNCLAVQPTTAVLAAAQQAGLNVGVEEGRQATAVMLLLAGIGLLVAGFGIWRRAHDWAAVSAAFGLTALVSGEFVRAMALETGRLFWIADILRVVAAAGLTVSFCLIPDGRVRSARHGWAVAVAALCASVAAGVATGPGLQSLFGIAALGVITALLAQQYRSLAGSARQELVTWALVALALLVGLQLTGRPLRLLPFAVPLPIQTPAQFFPGLLANGLVLGTGAIACLAVALLHDELFDIEFVLNRAMVYALLSLFVVAAYVLVVGYLSLVFQRNAGIWLSLIATGIVAALFNPVRTQVQKLVNQLLYGRRAEPYAAVSELSRKLEQSLSPNAVLPIITETIAGALRLPYAGIAVRAGDGLRLAAEHGTPPPESDRIRVPLVYQGMEIGMLFVVARSGEAALSGDDRRLLADLARQAAASAYSVQLSEDLRRSREQIVTAREEERRRLRRDLHDGLGPVLASQALIVDTIELLLERDPPAAASLLRRVKLQANEAVAEIRQMVHDLRPPALDDLGLIAALRELAGRGDAAGVEVHVDAPDACPPLPAAVEVAAYRIAAEALTNVLRHSHARSCVVSLAVGETLTLVVSDDGTGLPQEPGPGVGLHSMRERAEELGGTLVLAKRSGGGHSVRAVLPLRGGADAGSD